MERQFIIGIQANVDAGKTTLTEQMLYLSNQIRSYGSVDRGTTTSDFLEVERRRGISVKNACVELEYHNNRIRIIDTPGHLDFAGEVLRSLYALDGAVLLVSASDGAEGRTQTLFSALRNLKLPVVVCINKIDLAGFSREAALENLKEKLGGVFVPADLPPQEMLPLLAECDPDLEERFLMDEPVSDAEILEKLAKCTKESLASPVVFACAKEGEGVPRLLDTITACLPDTSCHAEEGLSGTVFGISHDPREGTAAMIRLFSGTLETRMPVPVQRLDPQDYEKIARIRRMQGGRMTDTSELQAGEIAAVYGLSDIRVGDVIGTAPEGRGEISGRMLDAEPLLLAEVLPGPGTEELKLSAALTELSQEEPLLAYERNTHTGQMFVHVMGEIQTEILTEILKERFSLEAAFSRPRVIYREKPAVTGYGEEAYLMPKPCWAIVKLKAEPLPAGSGILFESVIKEKELPYRYQEHVRQSIQKTVSQGLFGWEVIDTKFTLVGGMSHHVHTHPLDFFVATPIAMLRALIDAKETLYEPWMRITLQASETLLGKITGRIIRMNGSFSSPVMENGTFTMEAEAALRECVDFPTEFRSMTSGDGHIGMSLIEYRPAPPDLHETFPRRGVDPLDRAKWILACRSALAYDLTGRE